MIPASRGFKGRMRRKELTFRSVRRQRDCVGPIIEMLAAGRIDAQPLLTHRFPLLRIAEALRAEGRFHWDEPERYPGLNDEN